MRIYAVKRGWTTGIFETWDACRAAVKDYPSPKYRKFESRLEAFRWLGEVVHKPSGSEWVFVPAADKLAETAQN